jgi:hypothetical protein
MLDAWYEVSTHLCPDDIITVARLSRVSVHLAPILTQFMKHHRIIHATGEEYNVATRRGHSLHGLVRIDATHYRRYHRGRCLERVQIIYQLNPTICSHTDMSECYMYNRYELIGGKYRKCISYRFNLAGTLIRIWALSVCRQPKLDQNDDVPAHEGSIQLLIHPVTLMNTSGYTTNRERIWVEQNKHHWLRARLPLWEWYWSTIVMQPKK